MHHKALTHLERPVSFRTAAKKAAAIRGDEGREGGWIYNRHGYPVAHGWDAYGQLLFAAGVLAQDAEHNGGNGKWFVWIFALTAAEIQRAEALFGNAA
jgi:hypothetical protein